MGDFSVHIVLSDRGWILETLAKKLTSALPYANYDEDADPSADIQYYMTYGTWRARVSPVEAAYFAHLEKDGETAKHFFNVARNVEFCVCHSSPYETILRDSGIGHVRTISPGVDLDVFAPKVKIGVVGRTYHTGRKGEALIAQVMDIKGIEWRFTGAGWPGPALNLRDDQMPDFYNSLDYVLVPSLYEGGPMSVVEALACGCEVIAPPVGWVPQFPHIEYKTGDVEDLRRVLREAVAKKQSLRQSVIDRGWNAWVNGHDEVFSSLAARLEGKASARSAALNHERRVKRPALVLHGAERGGDKGGPSVRAPKTALRLSRLGCDASVRDSFMFDQRDHDLYHIYNIWHPKTCRRALEHARFSNAPIILSPIYLDLSESRYFNHDVPQIFQRSFNRAMVNSEFARLRERGLEPMRTGQKKRLEPYEGFHQDVRSLIESADHLILLSAHERDALKAIGADVAASTIIPNPVESARFAQATPDLFRDAYGLTDYILCVGRLEARKNQITLLHALRESGLPLVLVGHTTNPGYEKVLRSVAGPNAVFAGRIAPDSPMLASAYAGARIFCLPSWSEGAPLVALEAAAAGCNMVLSNRSSEREYFGSYARYIDPANPEQILDTIMEAYESPLSAGKRDELKAWTAQKYSWDNHIVATEQVYERVAGKKASSHALKPVPPKIYIDLTSSAHRSGTPSGISRVEERYALELCKLYPDRVRLVLWNSDRRQFVPVTYDQLKSGAHRRLSSAAAPAYYFDDEDMLPAGKIVFEPYSKLVVLGGAWIRNENYVRCLAATARRARLVLTAFIHDVIQAKFAQWFPDNVGNEFSTNCAALIDVSDHLIVNSNCTLNDVREFCQERSLVPPAIDVVRFGDEIEQTTDVQEEPQFAQLLPVIQGKPFILCVSAIDIRKNHILLYNLWERMIATYGEKTPNLICIGSKGWNIDHFLGLLDKNEKLKKYFHVLNGINDASLEWLYRNCLFTVYPSLYEGWGLPVAESLNYGKVCVAAKAGSVPEIAPDYTDLLDPLDFASWYNTVTSYAFIPHLLEARQKAIAHYKPVSWESSAKSLSGIIEKGSVERRSPPRLRIGQKVLFNIQNKGAFQPYAIGGWYPPENEGVWTAGRVALLKFKLEGRTNSSLLLELSGFGYPSEGSTQTVEVWCEGVMLGTLAWSRSKSNQVVVISSDMAQAMLDAPEITLEFRIGQPASPAERGTGTDRRLLGMMLGCLEFRQSDSVPLNSWVAPSNGERGAANPYAPIKGPGSNGAPNLKMPLFVRRRELENIPARTDAVYVGLCFYLRCAERNPAAPALISVRTPTRRLGDIQATHQELQAHMFQVPLADIVNGAVLSIDVLSGGEIYELEVVKYGVFSSREVCLADLQSEANTRNAPKDSSGPLIIDLRQGPPSPACMTLGWHGLEPEGMWSNGRSGSLKILARPRFKGDAKLNATIRLLANAEIPHRTVEVLVNGAVCGTYALLGGIYHEIQTVVPWEVMVRQPSLMVELRASHSFAPSAVGESDDQRDLGVFLEQLRFSDAEDVGSPGESEKRQYVNGEAPTSASAEASAA